VAHHAHGISTRVFDNALAQMHSAAPASAALASQRLTPARRPDLVC
jgi:hypothetical protein